jgi:hypothetical protein
MKSSILITISSSRLRISTKSAILPADSPLEQLQRSAIYSIDLFIQFSLAQRPPCIHSWFVPIPNLHHIQPLQRKPRHNPRPVLHRLRIQMFPVILHSMPHLGKRTGDYVQHLDALVYERQVVVADTAVARHRHVYIWQEGFAGAGLEEFQVAHAGLDGGEVFVRPVGGGEV